MTSGQAPNNPTQDGVTLAVLGTKLDYVIDKVDKIDDQTRADRRRLDAMENTISVLKWLGGTMGAVVLALTISWLKQVLGL